MLKQFETILVFSFFLFSIVFAELEYLGIDAKILGLQTRVKMTVFKPQKNFSISVSSSVENLTSNSNCETKDNKIICKNINVSSLNLQFYTSNIYKVGTSTKFYDQFLIPQNVKKVTCIVTLPVGAIVANRSDAVFPMKYKTLSNGRNIIVYWEIENASSFQPLVFKVYYQPATQQGISLTLTIKILIIVVSSLTIFFVSILKGKKEKREEMILEVLDEYEKKIFDLVRQHERIKQRKLVELTGFSKARVSRIVRSLAKRKLISVEHRGRNNIVKLRKKKARSFLS